MTASVSQNLRQSLTQMCRNVVMPTFTKVERTRRHGSIRLKTIRLSKAIGNTLTAGGRRERRGTSPTLEGLCSSPNLPDKVASATGAASATPKAQPHPTENDVCGNHGAPRGAGTTFFELSPCLSSICVCY